LHSNDGSLSPLPGGALFGPADQFARAGTAAARRPAGPPGAARADAARGGLAVAARIIIRAGQIERMGPRRSEAQTHRQRLSCGAR